MAGLGTVQRKDKDDFLGAVQVVAAVVQIVVGQAVTAFVNNHLGIFVSLLVPLVAVLGVGLEELAVPVAVVAGVFRHHQIGGGIFLEAAQPAVVHEEGLGGQHAGGVLVHTAVQLGSGHVGNALFHFFGQEVPYVFRSHLLGQVTGGKGGFIADFQRNVAPQVKEHEVVQGAQGANLCIGFLVVLDGLGLKQLVGFHDTVVAVVPLLPEVRNTGIRVVLVQVDVLGAPAAVGAVGSHDEVRAFFVDVEVAFPSPVHETELYIQVAQHVRGFVFRSGKVSRGKGRVNVLCKVRTGGSSSEDGGSSKSAGNDFGNGFHRCFPP